MTTRQPPPESPCAPSRTIGAHFALSTVAWLTLLGATAWLLHQLGTGPLGPPPLLHPARLATWADQRDAITVGFALIRLLATGFTWYLLLVTVLQAAAHASRRARLIALADLATVPFARRVFTGIAGISLTANVLGAGVASPDRPQLRLRPIATTQQSGVAQPGDHPTAGHLASQRADDPVPAGPAEPGTATIRVEDPAPAPAPPADPQWVVHPGDSFWSIARSTLEASWGGPPSDTQVVRYWEQLIDANRDRLADPANPDLIFDGQALFLPPTPPTP